MPDPPSGVRRPCPLCGEPDPCDLAHGRDSCWCAAVEPAPEIVELMEEEGLDGSCLCRRCLTGRVPSPCVGVCRLDDPGATCVGCLRTVEEVGAWSRLGARRRAEILLRVRRLGAPFHPEDVTVG